MADFSNKVIYQIYPKSFKDSNGDGIGDLRGVAEKLDYLKDLGVDYLWLTPFFVSPQRDNGYDVADYRNIDPMFGTMEDLDNLIAEGEKRNIGLMFDMVFNHTSTSHEWFRRALAGEKKYQDYYIFKEGAPDQPPTNWQSKFGGSAWEYVSSLGNWYLHLFDVTQADLNWKNPEVREELKEVIRFWKAKGVKGFRFDVVNLISKPEIWEDDFEGDGRKFYTDGPYVHEYLKELVRDTGIEDYVTVGEMSSTTLEHCIRYSGAEEKELSMCFNFHHLKVDYKDGNKWELMEPDYMELKVIFEKWQMGMQRGNAWNALFWCNHDQPRIVSRFGNEGEYWKESAKMLAGMIHLMRGTPYIYQGEEIGMTNPHYTSIEQYADVESRNYYEILLNEGKTKEEALEILAARSRDNSRTPMQWTDERYCGFSDTKPWIPVSDNFEKINVKKQKQDRDSILEFYKKLIMLRKEKEVIARGNIEFMEVENAGVLAYTRCLDKQKLLVCCNFRDVESQMEFTQEWKSGRKILGNYEENHKNNYKVLTLRPYEIIVLEKGEE
ncbi:alpha,alpha-phosphotrehalase [[Ruminococcus] torques]|uniref:alpha,alpha-phosphotrehalase n=1 Tax=[Ruminococcus] torques TaxID=33039 RepID=UPI0027B8878A|nr:alpha,alpha-phosphotrehalase [[Ruminococcus] torques]